MGKKLIVNDDDVDGALCLGPAPLPERHWIFAKYEYNSENKDQSAVKVTACASSTFLTLTAIRSVALRCLSLHIVSISTFRPQYSTYDAH